jgi:hypothetical protein|tara:strand:+ start:17205 stop:17387 length:183 start_codon:yes stop_codon:yes gene_type:complete
MAKAKPFWYVAFEREQLNTQQMERQKFYGGLERGTRPPSAEQLLKLLAQVNKNKQHLWLQ